MAENTGHTVTNKLCIQLLSGDALKEKADRTNRITVLRLSAGMDCDNPPVTHSDLTESASVNCDQLISTEDHVNTGSRSNDTARSLLVTDCKEIINITNNHLTPDPRAHTDLDPHLHTVQNINQQHPGIHPELEKNILKEEINNEKQTNLDCQIDENLNRSTELDTQTNDLTDQNDKTKHTSLKTSASDTSCRPKTSYKKSNNLTPKAPFAFEVDLNSSETTTESLNMPKKVKNSLQDAFLHFRKKRQDEIREERKRRDAILEANADPARMSKLREKIIAQAKRYFGVPYAKKYWQPNTPEYNSPIFLDCCGLVRQVVRDLQDDLGFRLGPWNQAYMFDTLPVTVRKKQMKPGDLVFMTGDYVNPKKKKQRHNMLHVEIWLGEGNKTIGSRWNNGKVGVFQSYKFDPKSFQNEQYIFKSIDTWLMGICHSYCSKHPWRIRKFNTSAKSIFNADDAAQDEKANPDSDDESDPNVRRSKSALHADVAGDDDDEDRIGSDGDGKGGGGGRGDGGVSSLKMNDVTLDITANTSRQSTPGSVASGNQGPEATSHAGKTVRTMISPRKFKTSLKNTIRVSGPVNKRDARRESGSVQMNTMDQEKYNAVVGYLNSVNNTQTCMVKPAINSRNGGGVTFNMDHDATVLSRTPLRSRRTSHNVADLTLLREASQSRKAKAATIVTSVVGRPNDSRGSGDGQAMPSQDILQDVAEHELDYIPNRLPSRNGSRSSNVWRTSKERDQRARFNKHQGSVDNGPSFLEAWVAPINSKNKNNDNKNKSKPKTVRDSVESSPTNKSTPSPNAALQSSETNLLFRTNTNFFRATTGSVGSSRGVRPAGISISDRSLRGNNRKWLQDDDEKITWRLSKNMSPERGCGPRNEALDLNKVSQKLNSVVSEEQGDIQFEDILDYSSDEEPNTGLDAAISGCLIIKKSPRKPLDTSRSMTSDKRSQVAQGKGNKHNNGIRKGYSQTEKRRKSINVTHGGLGTARVSGPPRVQYLSTAILQKAICPQTLEEQSTGQDMKVTDNAGTAVASMPPVDDGSVVVWAGTGSQVSSYVGHNSIVTSKVSVLSEKDVGVRLAGGNVITVAEHEGNLQECPDASRTIEDVVNNTCEAEASTDMPFNKPLQSMLLCQSSVTSMSSGDEERENIETNESKLNESNYHTTKLTDSGLFNDIQAETDRCYEEMKKKMSLTFSEPNEDDLTTNNYFNNEMKTGTTRDVCVNLENIVYQPKPSPQVGHTPTVAQENKEYRNSKKDTLHICKDKENATNAQINVDHSKEEELDIMETSFTSDLSEGESQWYMNSDKYMYDRRIEQGYGGHAVSDSPSQIDQLLPEETNFLGSDCANEASETNNMFYQHDGGDENEKLSLSDYDSDTDVELESAMGLTTLHNLCHGNNYHTAMEILSHGLGPAGDAGYDKKTPEDLSVSLNKRLAVLGEVFGVGPPQFTNPAWEWLYSFPRGVVTNGNANNNSNAGSGYDVGRDRTSLAPGQGDLDNPEQENVRYCKVSFQESYPVHKSLVPGQKANTKPVTAFGKKNGTVASKQEDQANNYTNDQLRCSNLLANYVLNQQPKGHRGYESDDSEGDNNSRIIEDGIDIVSENNFLFGKNNHRGNSDSSDSESQYDDETSKRCLNTRNCRQSTFAEATGFDFSQDSASRAGEKKNYVSQSVEDTDKKGRAYEHGLKYPQLERGDSRKSTFNTPRSGINRFSSPGLRLRKRESSAWSTPCFIGDGNNNRGVCDDGEDKDDTKAKRGSKAKSPKGDKYKADSLRPESNPEHLSMVPELPPMNTGQPTSSFKTNLYDLLGARSKSRQSCDVDIERDEQEPDGRSYSFDSLSSAVKYQKALLSTTFPELTFTSQQEMSFWENPSAPLWRLSRLFQGASAKSHTGKQATGTGGGGGTNTQTGTSAGGGDKNAGEKTQSSTDPAEGGGDEGGKGGNRGGGNRRPSRPPKLPQCCLPNNMQPTFYIGGGNGTALVEAPLLSLGWKRITDKNDERYRLKWVENKSRINYIAFREGEQLVNHIPNCKLLTNKLGLLCSLQEYERVTLLTKGRTPRMKMADFVPETYKLDERVDREKFLSTYVDGETWICKPTGLSQGKGIFLLRSREEINNLLSEREAKQQSKSITRQPLMRIVQRYINKPMLLDNRKFDIRAYMLIASTVPYLVLFHQGYVRLSCQKYDAADTNLTTHLTNQFVQKKDPSYKDNKEDTAWTMEKFNDYINETLAKEKGLDQDWVFGYLTKQMQRICLHCFNSVKHKLQCKIGYFDLYGLDFMVDEDMKVWLIEINANPALHTNCRALKEAIPPVVETGLYVAVECFDKSRKGQPLMPVNSLAGYNVLYCGASPNAAAPRQIRSVSPFKDAGEWASRPAGHRWRRRRKKLRKTPNYTFLV